MNCVAMTPATNPASVLARPATPSTPPDNASWQSPATVPLTMPAVGPKNSAVETTTTNTRSMAMSRPKSW